MKKQSWSPNVQDISMTPLQQRMGMQSSDRQQAEKQDRVAPSDTGGGGNNDSRWNTIDQGNAYKTRAIRSALTQAGKQAYTHNDFADQVNQLRDILQKAAPK